MLGFKMVTAPQAARRRFLFLINRASQRKQAVAGHTLVGPLDPFGESQDFMVSPQQLRRSRLHTPAAPTGD